MTVAAECLDRMREAQAAVKEHGLLVETSYGLKANPALSIEKDARNGLLAALKQLNLDLVPLQDRGRPTNPIGVSHADH